jgi:ATP-dependent DNA helicase RecG
MCPNYRMQKTVIYPERESRHLEFKSVLPVFSQLIKTCVAFANGVGGKIIVGVEDSTRKIIGINDEIRNKLYDEFPNSLYDSTSPGLIPEIYEKNYGSENVIIIEIPNVLKKPVFIKKEGIPKGVYLRAGSSTRRANEEHIEELVRESKRIAYDEEAVTAPIEILSDERLENLYPKYTPSQLLSEKIIVHSAIIKKQYFPTIAGTLWFCEKPDVYVEEAHVRCTRFEGISGRDIIQSEEIRGCLKDQIENTVNLISSWLKRNYTLKEAQLKGKMIIPETALREAIVNAIVHRKYTIIGSIKIALYDNRLEIFSPGNFPGLVDINNLGDGTTYLRNPSIARIARRMEYMEKLGTGINLMRESCASVGLREPEFIEGADSVKVIFHFIPVLSSSSTDEENLLKLFSMREEVSLTDAMQYLGSARNTATRKLKKLLENGKIIRIGKGPSIRYRIKK